MQVLPREWHLSYNQVSILHSGLFAKWTSGQESTGLKDHERCGSGETLMWWRVERVKEWKLWLTLTLSPRMNLLNPGRADFNEVRTYRWPRTAKTDLFLQNLMQMSTRNPPLHPTLPILCFPWEQLGVLKSLCHAHGGSSLKSSVRSASETNPLIFRRARANDKDYTGLLSQLWSPTSDGWTARRCLHLCRDMTGL